MGRRDALQIVFGGAHQPAAAGEIPAGRHALIRSLLQSFRRPLVDRRDSRQTIVEGIEKRVFHPDRFEDALPEKRVEGLPRDDFHDASQRMEHRVRRPLSSLILASEKLISSQGR